MTDKNRQQNNMNEEWIEGMKTMSLAGLILGLHPANERLLYFVTTSLTGWVQT